jgi:hypothetical protein
MEKQHWSYQRNIKKAINYFYKYFAHILPIFLIGKILLKIGICQTLGFSILKMSPLESVLWISFNFSHFLSSRLSIPTRNIIKHSVNHKMHLRKCGCVVWSKQKSPGMYYGKCAYRYWGKSASSVETRDSLAVSCSRRKSRPPSSLDV